MKSRLDRDSINQTAIARIFNANVLLDIGAGIQPKDFVHANVYICAEPFQQYVETLKENLKNDQSRSYVTLNLDWRKTIEALPDHSIDVVLLIDVIEHLEKQEGEELLALTLKKVKHQIVIFTPVGFVKQHTNPDGTDAWGLNGQDWQEHKSGWLPEEFDDSWDTFVCDDYHQTDNLGRALPKAEGAFWAIKNLTPNPNQQVNLAEIERLRDKFQRLSGRNAILERDLQEKIDRLNRIESTFIYSFYRFLKRQMALFTR